ncbi:hypothetical protein M422DRAFT_774306 [Sphaerobolus stellatus SS14]|nr:hypothetical protein M422DRAFT_774306 [Sphaerobolus stellatus SS14]
MAAVVEPWQNTNKSRRKACGECRRLKLRCEKVFPCESCQKRGCAAICPDGSFMKGTRSLKTSALKLHEKMAQMSTRIRELEEALGSLQATVSAEPHPLLDGPPEDEERPRSPIPIATIAEGGAAIGDHSDDLAEALGYLTIRPFGESQFHGETASSEYLLQVNGDQGIQASQRVWDQTHASRLEADLVLFSVLFPFPPSIMGEPVTADRFLKYIPSYHRAVQLSEIYFDHFAWCSLPIPKDELYDILNNDIFTERTNTERIMPTSLNAKISLHRLSLILMVFALGALFDANTPICSVEAEDYHSLARAALCGDQIFNSTSLDCIQSMCLMVWYMRMCPGRRSNGYLWAFSGLLSKLVQAIGLHREPNAKSFPAAEVLKRQTTFWEFVSGDVWQSFVFGRPSSMVFSQIDCKKPREVTGSVGAPQGLFYRWKYGFTNLVGDVLTLTTGATATNYRRTCELEAKIRDYPIPVELQFEEATAKNLFETERIAQTLQRFIIRLWQNAAILYIHRRYLVQAMSVNTRAPIQTPYGQSVIAAYDAACKQIRDLLTLYGARPQLVSRMHPYWSHAFSAAIVLGSLVARSPWCELSPEAMKHFKEALHLFTVAQGTTVQPPNAVLVLATLDRKASYAFERQESYQDVQHEVSDEVIALGALGQVMEPAPPMSNGHSNHHRNTAGMYMHPTNGAMNYANGMYDHAQPLHHGSYAAHAAHAAQWLHSQAYFPPQPGSEGQNIEHGNAESPSSNGTTYDAGHMIDGQAEWQHVFMQSMGV